MENKDITKQYDNRIKIIKRLRIVFGFLLLSLVFTLFFVYRSKIDFAGITNVIGMIDTGVSSTSSTGEISFDQNPPNRFAYYNGGLAVLSSDGFDIYSLFGKQKFSYVMKTSTPALVSCDDYVIAYEHGGYGFTVFNSYGKVFENPEPLDSPIINISINSSGYFAVVTGEVSYKGSVTVYDNRFNKLFKWFSAEKYVIDAVVSPDCKNLAVLCISNLDSSAVSVFEAFNLSSNSDQASFSTQVPDTLLFKLDYKNNDRVLAIGDTRAITFNMAGKVINECGYDGMSITNFDTGLEDFSALVLNDKTTSSRSEIVLLNTSGLEIARAPVFDNIIALSAYSKTLCVLTLDKILVFDKELAEQNVLENQVKARNLIMKNNAQIILIADSKAYNINV